MWGYTGNRENRNRYVLRDPGLFRKVKILITEFCVLKGFSKSQRVSDSAAIHTALLLCEKHLDPAKSAVVVQRERLQDEINRHVGELVETEKSEFIKSAVESLNGWLGLNLVVRKVDGRFLISSEGESKPRPAIPFSDLAFAPAELKATELDINNVILGMN